MYSSVAQFSPTGHVAERAICTRRFFFFLAGAAGRRARVSSNDAQGDAGNEAAGAAGPAGLEVLPVSRSGQTRVIGPGVLVYSERVMVAVDRSPHHPRVVACTERLRERQAVVCRGPVRDEKTNGRRPGRRETGGPRWANRRRCAGSGTGTCPSGITVIALRSLTLQSHVHPSGRDRASGVMCVNTCVWGRERKRSESVRRCPTCSTQG